VHWNNVLNGAKNGKQLSEHDIDATSLRIAAETMKCTALEQAGNGKVARLDPVEVRSELSKTEWVSSRIDESCNRQAKRRKK
jgi:hypothetical protein